MTAEASLLSLRALVPDEISFSAAAVRTVLSDVRERLLAVERAMPAEKGHGRGVTPRWRGGGAQSWLSACVGRAW